MSSTIRVNPGTKTRLRGYKKHPRATDDEVLNWILDQLEKETQK